MKEKEREEESPPANYELDGGLLNPEGGKWL